MTALKKLIDKHPVATFFLLAYGITWSIWTPISYGYVQGSIELSPSIVLLYTLGGFGPLLAAAIVAVLSGQSLRAWFSQALKWRVSIKWWLAALFIPVLLYAAMAGIHVLLGGKFNLSEVSPLLSVPGVFLTVFLWGGGNEELGWRGLALPRLQERHNALLSSLIIGVVWTIWHAPPGIIELGFVKWAVDLPFYMTTVTGISFVATWLYNGSGGSVLLTMVFHASVNASQSLYPVEDMFSPNGEYARTGAWILLVITLTLIPQKRHTNHNLYKGRKIPRPEMAQLHACIFEKGFWMFSTNEGPYTVFSEEELRRRIDELITRADAIQLTDSAYTKELASWIGRGAFGAPWLVAKIGQLAVSYLNISKGQTKKDSEMILSAPALVALASADNDRKSQVMAGQIYEKIALTAASLGIATHPMSQILQVPEIKAELRELLETPEVKAQVAGLSPEEHLFLQHTFRLGYAEAEDEHTPRRPIEEVLV
jgi:membrane protease YdiL (CAAX protease family)